MDYVGLAATEGAAMRLDSTERMTEGGDETATEGGLDGLAGIGFNDDKIGDVGLDGLTEIGVEHG